MRCKTAICPTNLSIFLLVGIEAAILFLLCQPVSTLSVPHASENPVRLPAPLPHPACPVGILATEPVAPRTGRYPRGVRVCRASWQKSDREAAYQASIVSWDVPSSGG